MVLVTEKEATNKSRQMEKQPRSQHISIMLKVRMWTNPSCDYKMHYVLFVDIYIYVCSIDTALTYVDKDVFSVCFSHSSFDCCCVVHELPYSFLSVCRFSTTGACAAKELVAVMVHCSHWLLALPDLLLFCLFTQKAAPCIKSIRDATKLLSCCCHFIVVPPILRKWLTLHSGHFKVKDTCILFCHIYSEFLFIKETTLSLTVC